MGEINGAARWIPAAELPDQLDGALSLRPTPETAHVWESGQAIDVGAARAAFAQAREMADLQAEYAEDLADALSPADLAADNAAARRVRDARRRRSTDREIERVEAEERAARHEQRLTEAQQRQAERLADLRQRVQAETDPTQGLARLNLARWLSPAVALVPAVFAAVAEAVNVGSTMGKLSPDTAAINWSLGPLFTIPLVAIMIAQLLGAVPLPGQAVEGRRFVAIQIVLFAAAVVMNIGPHVLLSAPAKHTLPWLSIPAGFGLSMWLVPSLRAHLNAEFVRAADAAGAWLTTTGDRVSPDRADLHGTNPGPTGGTNPDRESGTGVPTPARRSIADHRARLAELVQTGQITPETVSVNACRQALRCRREIARDLLVQDYGRTDLS